LKPQESPTAILGLLFFTASVLESGQEVGCNCLKLLAASISPQGEF